MAAYSAGTGNLTDITSTSLGGTVGGAGLVQAAYDRMVEFALRATPLIRAVADKRPAKQAMPGSSVALQIYKDLDTKTGTLTESQDVDTISLATPDIVSVSLLEYGSAALTTRKLDLFSLADVDPAVANIIAYNMADSMDYVAQNELLTGTNVIYSGDATATINVAASATDANNDVIRARDIRRAVAKLRANKAVPRKGQYFWCGIHPEVSHDLRAESTSTSAANWRDPHLYANSQDNIWAGEIGAFEGAYFIESPRLYNGFLNGVQSYEGGSTGSGSFTKVGTVTAGALKTVVVTVALTTAQAAVVVGNLVTGTGVTVPTRVTAISTDRLTLTVDTDITAGASVTFTIQPTNKVYRTFLAGQQALAEAVAEEPHVVIGPVVDRLMRFRPIGWYGVLGFKIYRQNALYRIESVSSIA
jgi:N4-gp56 family major capsid protein